MLLVALGLAAAGVATHYALQAFLLDRVDQEFARAEGPAGSVEVESPPAGGAVFRMLLPLPLG